MRAPRTVSILIGVCAVVAMAGCGGGVSSPGASGGRGALQMTIHWPAPSRLIPITSQGIVVVVKSTSGAVLASPPVVTRPVGTTPVSNLTIPNVPVGQAVVFATAYPNPDGSGNAQASGSTPPVTVKAGTTVTTPALVMNTTVTKIVLTPSATSVTLGGQITVSASAQDANSNVVVVAPDHYAGAANDPTAFGILHGGTQFTLTAQKIGNYTFTVTEPESGVSSPPLALTVTAVSVAKVFVMDQTNSLIDFLSDTAPGASFVANSLGYNSTDQFWDMATDSAGHVYVALTRNQASGVSTIIEVDAGGNFVGSFNPTFAVNGGQASQAPYQMCVDPQGRVYWFGQVPNTVGGGVINTIYRVDSINGFPGTLKSTPVASGFQVPQGLASDGQFLYALDGTGGRIYRINADLTGSWSAPYGTKGSGQDNLDPGGIFSSASANHGLALDPSGTHLYVADYNNARIVQITAAGFNSLPSTSGFAFTDVPLANSGTNGATYFKPISVAIDGADQHVYFSGIEVKDKTGNDVPPPSGTNVVNSFAERIDVAGVASHSATNLSTIGGAFTTGGTANLFGKPAAIGAK